MKKSPRQGLFHGHWFTLAGRKIGRVRRREIAEAYRLWSAHKDIREGSPRPVFSTSNSQPFAQAQSLSRSGESNPFH